MGKVIKRTKDMIVWEWEPPQASTLVKKLSLATIERHRQIINKMEREKLITPAKAKVLRQELKAQL